MPLPPAPGRRAARLSPEAYENKVNPARASSRTVAAEPEEVNETIALEAPTAAAPMRRRARNTAEAATKAAAPAVATPKSTTSTRQAAAKKTISNTPVTASNGSQGKSLPRSKKTQGPAKLFVLDTNVLLHDPTSLFRFEEHDIFLPMIVLEELDAHKKGMTEVARNGRQTSRTLDALAGVEGADIGRGLKLDSTGQRAAGGCLYFQTAPLDYSLPTSLPAGKADNQILGVVAALAKEHAPREVVLVSKDINMRVKARALGLNAEDYQNDKTLDDGDLLYAGVLALPQDFWSKSGKNVESWQSGAHTYYRIGGPIVPQLMINQFVYFEAPGEPSLFARVSEIREKTAVLQTLKDFGSAKNAVWGVTTRNREQNFAMNLLMDPEIDFVTLTGTAGTGKTLLALAVGLTQVLDD
ncbi:MAG: phosphate starvation-inducible protein PhoH, partial [Verminephrobacter sp.]|nr:phosphate starvation-inducible protein PhoH [Verminephrobacter sp.]